MALITRRENKNEATIQTTNKNSTSYAKGIFFLIFTGMFTRKHSTADEVSSNVSGNHNTVAKIRNEPYFTPIITLIP